MNETKSATPMVVTAVVVGILGLAIGFAISRVTTKKTDSTAMTQTAQGSDTKAADLRAALVSLAIQHQNLTAQAVDSALDGNADAASYKALLIKNGGDISAAVGSVYGQPAADAFQKLWNVHLVDFVNYAVAAKTGNAAAKTAALADIQTNYTTPLAALLSGANPNLPNDTLVTQLGDHVTMTAQVIDDHVAGKYDAETTDLQAADTHVAGLFSTLAGAIVKQYPSKF